MKKVIFLSLFFIATPVFGQVISLDENLVNKEPTVKVEAAPVATTTLTDPVSTTTEITETIEIVPGGLSLKLSTTVPVNAHPATTTQELVDDGLFDLIYTGFEEFVFKVFGI